MQGNNRIVSKSLANCFLIIPLQNIVVGLQVFGYLSCAANYLRYLTHQNQGAVANFSPAGNDEVMSAANTSISRSSSENHAWPFFFLKYRLPREKTFLFHFLLKVTACSSRLQFNISYQWIHRSHYYPHHPWQNTPVIVTDNKNKNRETLTDMQIQTLSPFIYSL